MISYADVKQSPSLREEKPVKDFELALSELIDSYRKHVSKTAIASALSLHADLVANDETWTQTQTSPATEEEGAEGETADQDVSNEADADEGAEKPA
jgi:hypothetical protein